MCHTDPTKLRVRQYTLEQVRQHNKPESNWICIRGKVYDISNWKNHPGGQLVLQTVAGHDVTDQFIASHPPEVHSMLSKFEIGEIPEWKASPLQLDYWGLIDTLTKEGMFSCRKSYYVGKVAWQVLMFSLTVYFSCYSTSFLAKMLGSVCLAGFWHQMSFLGHDAGHNSVSHDRQVDYWGGLMVTTFYGVSAQWWKRSHNMHHIVTNSIESDPDIQHLPFLAVTQEFFKSIYSTYHQRQFLYTRVAKFFVSRQYYLYYLAMVLARYNFYVQSFIFLWKTEGVRRRLNEVLALLVFWVWYLTLMRGLDSYWIWLPYTFVAHALTGLVHAQITLSHFAMPTYHGVRTHNQEFTDSFIHMQVETSMNVDCPQWLDWVHGGLQFQIEHHLFPRMPRHNLRYVRDMYMKPLCAKYNLQYVEYDFITGHLLLINHLKERSAEAMKFPAVDEGANSVISEGISFAENQFKSL